MTKAPEATPMTPLRCRKSTSMSKPLERVIGIPEAGKAAMLPQIVYASVAINERNSDVKPPIELAEDHDAIERSDVIIEAFIFADPCLSLTRVPAEIGKFAIDEIACD
ncbi:hypothetical protein K9B35_07775 [Sphingomonas sp. R647]|uniref:hypothetical protein n=1 Tax=Sphingomonas sp. R647 TaxID=2875233 RepID=UPI001CD4D2C6|nr:hypothetical protein [Sphingomonas sp. R647]MCA1197862.1 hypothetical protein [Sphingomonas sp. R647]